MSSLSIQLDPKGKHVVHHGMNLRDAIKAAEFLGMKVTDTKAHILFRDPSDPDPRNSVGTTPLRKDASRYVTSWLIEKALDYRKKNPFPVQAKKRESAPTPTPPSPSVLPHLPSIEPKPQETQVPDSAPTKRNLLTHKQVFDLTNWFAPKVDKLKDKTSKEVAVMATQELGFEVRHSNLEGLFNTSDDALIKHDWKKRKPKPRNTSRLSSDQRYLAGVLASFMDKLGEKPPQRLVEMSSE